MGKIAKLFLKLLLSFLNLIFPKSKNVLFMCDVDGVGFNLISLFKYIAANYQKRKVYYFIKNKERRDLYRKKYAEYRNVFFISNVFVAAYYRLRSKCFFSEQVVNPFMCLASSREKVISLWHGMGLKRIGYEANKTLYYNGIDKTFTKQLCYSPFSAEIMKKSFLFDDKKVLISQNPRNDEMYKDKDLFFSENGIDKSIYSKIVLWLPTFRTTNKISNSDIDFPLLKEENIDMLDLHLRKTNQLLIIKLHPAQKNVQLFAKSFTNILVIDTNIFLRQKGEFYNLIGSVDALITDYSSVAFDYMQLSRPIGYVLDDFEVYNEKRGFNVDNPLELMPGAHIFCLDDLLSFFNSLRGDDSFKGEREKVCKLVNQFSDWNNCKRVVEFALDD